MRRAARQSRLVAERGVAVALASFVLLGLVSGCDPARHTDVDTSKPAEFGFQTSLQTSLEDEGAIAYRVYCIGCHGEKGDGNTLAARFLNPRPRNFQVANFRFSSTRAGQLPTDDDLRRSIREGLKGSAMPPFDLVPPRTVDALVAYIKTFSSKWKERGPSPAIPIVDDPYRNAPDKSAAIARGKAVYHGFAKCWSCHPAYVPEAEISGHLVSFENPAQSTFRPGLFESEGKPNAEGEVIYPPDFRRDFVRAGAEVDDLYRSIAAGITGTAMPTWVDSIDVPSSADPGKLLATRADLWAMAYYVQHLIRERPVKLRQDQVVVRTRPRPIDLKSDTLPVAPSEPENQTTQEVFEE